MTAGRRVALPILLLALLGTAVYFIWHRIQPLPGPDTALYQEYQRDFHVGVGALEAGREDLARENLERATQLIPREPAAWANLGLLDLRKNNLDEAARHLEKARALAPTSGEIEALSGLLAEKQGRLSAAVDHFRKAAAQDPGDLASVYALAEAVSKEGGAGSDAEYQRLMEQLLKLQPNNMPVLLQRAGAAFRRQDDVAFRATLDRLAELAPAWSARSQEALVELRDAARKAPNEVLQQLQVLDNVLKAERGYKRDSFIIRPQPGWVGTPVRHFLALAEVRSRAAPPDMALKFRIESQPGADPAHWDALCTMWLMNDNQRANDAVSRECDHQRIGESHSEISRSCSSPGPCRSPSSRGAATVKSICTASPSELRAASSARSVSNLT